MIVDCSKVGSHGLGGNVTVARERVLLVVGELDGDAKFSLERVQHVPVLVASAILGVVLELHLERSDLGHGLVDVARLRADHVRRVILGVPRLGLAEGIVSKPPIVPRENHAVDGVLQLGEQANRQSFPVGILLGSHNSLDLLNLFGSCEGAIEAAKAGDERLKPKQIESLLEFEGRLELTRQLVTLRTDLKMDINTRLN